MKWEVDEVGINHMNTSISGILNSDCLSSFTGFH